VLHCNKIYRQGFRKNHVSVGLMLKEHARAKKFPSPFLRRVNGKNKTQEIIPHYRRVKIKKKSMQKFQVALSFRVNVQKNSSEYINKALNSLSQG